MKYCNVGIKKQILFLLVLFLGLIGAPSVGLCAEPVRGLVPQEVPVGVATVENRDVSDRIDLIGNTEPIAKSTIASEFPGVVEEFFVREGDFVEQGSPLVRLRSTGLKLRLKASTAAKGKVGANLQNAESELRRLAELQKTQSIAARRYEEADYLHRALSQELLKSEADIEYLEYELRQKTVKAPFSGFVAEEHTQVGEFMREGGAVVTLHDLGKIRVTVDVPERYAVMLKPDQQVSVLVRSVSLEPIGGRIYSVLPNGNPSTRTFPVRIHLENPGLAVKSGMEALAAFNLSVARPALVVPKDAVVTQGDARLVYAVSNGKAMPVPITVLGYYDGDVSFQGDLKAGDQVVVRGNERLRPGIPVRILK